MKPIRLVIMPEKPSLLAAVGLWLLHRLGCLSKDVTVIKKGRVSQKVTEVLSNTDTYLLMGKDLQDRLYQLPRILDRTEFKMVRSLIAYANMCIKLDEAVKKLSRQNMNPQLFQWFVREYYLSTNFIDVFSEMMHRYISSGESLNEFIGSLPDQSSPVVLPSLPDYKTTQNQWHVTIPVWNRLGLDAKMIDTEVVRLPEERVRILEDNSLRVAICGPPNSGKSTTSATMVSETKNVLDSLATRPDFHDLAITVGGVDLDLGSQTLDSISQGEGSDREKHAARKKPWDIEDVYTALAELNKRKENIIFLDIPGKISKESHLLLSMADVGIIVSYDFDRVNEWRKVLTGFGIKPVAEARSHRLASEKYQESMVRIYDSGHSTGRIVGVQRKLRNWDSYYLFLSRALLYAYLPTHITRKHQQKQYIINSIWRENP